MLTRFQVIAMAYLKKYLSTEVSQLIMDPSTTGIGFECYLVLNFNTLKTPTLSNESMSSFHSAVLEWKLLSLSF